MLSYDISKAGSESLYRYLYKRIKADILQGKLKADDQLPSKRPFAQQLGVSIITVLNAYLQLLAEGFIYSLPRKGFFVSAIKTNESTTPIKSNFAESFEAKQRRREDQLYGYENSIIKEKTSLPKKKTPFINLTNTQADSSTFPFSTWAKITRKVLCEQQGELMERAPYGGVLPLRQAISKHLRDFRNIQVSPEQIIVGAGTDYLYSLLVQLLGFDKKYGVEDPGYSKISKIYRKMNVTCNFIPMDSNGVIIDQLEETCTDVIHLSPSHHYPTGIVTPISRRYELLSWASKSRNRYIVEDDYDSEFRMVGGPIPPLQSIDASDKVIYINTFSKSLASTIRVSYMVLPKPLAQKFREEYSFYTCTVSNLEQYTLARYMAEGNFETHINRMRNYYRSHRDAILHAIQKSKLSSIAKISGEDAGLHFILEIQTQLSDEEFCNRAKEKNILMGALSYFYTEAPKCAHMFIVNYAAIEESKMIKVLNTLYTIATE